MPPKEKLKQNAAGGKIDGGKEGTGRDDVVPEGEPMDAMPSGATVTAQQVRQIAEKLQAACGKFAEALADSAEMRLRDHGATEVVLKDVKSFLSKSKGTGEISQLVEDLRKAVTLEAPCPAGTEVHPGSKRANFQDILENARSSIHTNLNGFLEFVGHYFSLDEAVWLILEEQKGLYMAQDDAALHLLECQLKERLEKEVKTVSFDVGRGSFAWDDSTEPGSGIAEKRLQEIETLKAQCEDLQSKLWEADRRIAEMVEQVDRLPVLDSARKLLRCEDLELDGKIAELLRKDLESRTRFRGLQDNIDDLKAQLANANAVPFQADDRKIAELEQQLRDACDKLQKAEKSNAELQQQLRKADDKFHQMKTSKDNLEQLMEAQQKHDAESTGRRQSLEERLQALGLVGGQQGSLQRASQPVLNQGFCVSTPYSATNRFVGGQAS